MRICSLHIETLHHENLCGMYSFASCLQRGRFWWARIWCHSFSVICFSDFASLATVFSSFSQIRDLTLILNLYIRVNMIPFAVRLLFYIICNFAFVPVLWQQAINCTYNTFSTNRFLHRSLSVDFSISISPFLSILVYYRLRSVQFFPLPNCDTTFH